MRVYAICRQCAEVHLASAGCPGCTRSAALGRRAPFESAAARDGSGGAHGPRGETTALLERPARRRPAWLSAAVVGAYLLAILGLVAAVTLGQLPTI